MKKILFILLAAICFTDNNAQVLNTGFCQTNGTVEAMAIDSVNNVVYIGGAFTSVCGQPRSRLAAMNLTTGALLAWNPGANNDPYSMYIHNNALYVGGFFTVVGGQSHKLVAKFYLPTGMLSTWAPAITSGNWVEAIVAKDNKVYLGGNFLLSASTGKNICEIDTGTAIATTWSSATTDNTVHSLSIDGNNLYVGGEFTTIASTSQSYIAKITIPSGAPLAWNPAPDGPVYALLTKASKVYMAGMFSFLNLDGRAGIGCADGSTGIATAWNPGCNGQPTKLLYRNGIIYAVGNNFSVLGGKQRFFIGAIDINSGWVSNWNINAGGSLFAAATTSTQIYLGGSMSTVLGQTRTNFAVVCINPIDSLLPFTTAPTTICAGRTGVTYSVPTTTGATSYVWNYSGAGVTINGNSNNVTLDFSTSATSGTLSVSATNGCETSAAQTIPITIYTLTANISAPNNNYTCGNFTAINSTNNYSGSGSLTYAWLPATGLNATNTPSVTANPIANTDYTLSIISSEGCSTTNTQSIIVNPFPLSASANNYTITCGNASQITSTNNYTGIGTLTYSWSPSTGLNNTTISNPSATPISSTVYNLTVTSSEGCVSSTGVSIAVNLLQIMVPSSANIVCHVSAAINTTNNSNQAGLIFSWNPTTGLNNSSAASPIATVGQSTIYSVTMSLPSSGCANATGTVSINVAPPAQAQICMVTADSLSKYNIIYWDKTAFLPSDKFMIYREVTTGTYLQIGTVPGDSLSRFIDTVRSIGPANGNPNIGTYRYQLRVEDSCSNIGVFSAYHNTVFFVDNGSGTFTWNTYVVQGQTTPVTQFDLLRDNANNGIWTLVGSVAGTQTTLNDPSYSTYQAIANWRVQALGFNCTPTLRATPNGIASAVVKSKSNITNNRQIGINQSGFGGEQLVIHPNPTNGNLTISFTNSTSGKVSVKIMSAIGQEVYSETFTQTNENHTIDLSKYENGIYLVQITTNNTTVIKRIVKN